MWTTSRVVSVTRVMTVVSVSIMAWMMRTVCRVGCVTSVMTMHGVVGIVVGSKRTTGGVRSVACIVTMNRVV